MYKELIEKSENSTKKAMECFIVGEMDLAKFYYNVARGFELRARDLPVEVL